MPKISKFSGLNNTQRPELCRPGFFQTMTNVLVTDDGTVKRRFGRVEVAIGAAHSFYSAGTTQLYAAGGDLLLADFSAPGAPTVLSALAAPDDSISYLPLNGQIYFGNGTDSGVIVAGALTPWAIEPPTAPAVANAGGTGDPGTYLVSLVYRCTDGQESAASATVAVAVTTGGIAVSGIPTSTDPRVAYVDVYISAPNGEAGATGSGLYRAATLANAAASVTIAALPAGGPRCATLNLSPMPAGRHMLFYRGRVYVAVGEWYVYSQPWNYGLTNLDENVIPCLNTITSGIALENGICVGTTKDSVFLAGADPMANGGFQVRSRIASPCITGGIVVDQDTLPGKEFAPGPRGLFVAEDGVYGCDGNGMAQKLTPHWAPGRGVPAAAAGFVDITDAHGTWYLFKIGTDVYAFNLKNAAVTKLMVSGDSFGVYDGVLHVADAYGIWALSGDTDDETLITAVLAKEGIDFQSNMIKRFTSAYLHMRSTGNLSVVTSGQTGTGTTVLYDGIATMHGSRVKLPRGVQGRNLAITLTNNNGAFFEIAEMDLVTEITSRHARQTA